ncbi:MAG: hypothetical protein IPJ98_13775 [Bryobacterales bacterium]|nr:hypothetical protein [Bryobacterales bacterium]
MTRRDFLAVTSAAAAAAPGMAAEKAAHKSTSETLVATLFKSLTAEQRPAVVFPFDHALRSKVDANWFIVPQRIGQFFNRDQQAMIREIFTGLYRPEFAPKVMAQVKEDAGGIENYSAALFGEPGGEVEFVITGRHCTMRCDGDSVDGAALAGPSCTATSRGRTTWRRPTTARTSTGIRPAAPTRCSPRSTASSANWRW